MPHKKDLDSFRGEMGETIVIYELLKRGWNVFRNMGGRGYDLRAVSEDNMITRQIEIKTTDPKLKTGATKNQLTVVLSAAERDNASHCIFYVHGYNAFFIIPKDKFPPGGSITVHVSKANPDLLSEGTMFEPFKNKWNGLK
jgi:hypothetical protein